MLRFILFLGALIALPALAQTESESGAATDAPAAPAQPQEVAPDAPASPELTPEQKLTQFRHDEINLLALRPDPESLIAATLLADADTEDKTRPAVLKAPALLRRAQAVGTDSVLVWWVTAAAECHASRTACPSTETLQKLEGLDAENAAVWTLSLWRAQQIQDAPAARAALASAAQAKHYNDYFGTLIAAIFQAEQVLPIDIEMLRTNGQDAAPDGFRLITAANMAATLALPGYRAVADACKPADRAGDSTLTTDCLALARKMEASGSINTQNFALRLQESLLDAGPELAAVRARERTLGWQNVRIGELSGRLAEDSRVTRIYMQALAESGNESAAVHAVLRNQGVALEPPEDWQLPSVTASPLP